MSSDFAPKQNWEKYDAFVASRELDRMSELTPEQKFQNYAALFNLIHTARPRRGSNHPLEIQRWHEKLQRRKCWVQLVAK